ncbi:A24 family peptidase [Gorillibacterium timonense]|uniref:A24 family peptidase n=1 Tax=Gorillibacterium timonense TaxID=1689269 RepID=UPI00071E628E|nr:prepilin peptidase [Gorillibacterium timonense]
MEWVLLGALITAAGVTDIRRSRIPNAITITGAGAGIVLQLAMAGWSGAWNSILGLMIGFAPLFLLYLFGALGAGDVKLFAAIGAISGGVFALNCAFYSILFAGLIGIVILIARRLVKDRFGRIGYLLMTLIGLKDVQPLASANRRDMLRFPFMYAAAPAIVLMAADSFTGKGWGFL